jgi:hypothetical protein
VAAVSILFLVFLYLGLPALILFALYWIVRRAVSAGIRDARREPGNDAARR